MTSAVCLLILVGLLHLTVTASKKTGECPPTPTTRPWPKRAGHGPVVCRGSGKGSIRLFKGKWVESCEGDDDHCPGSQKCCKVFADDHPPCGPVCQDPVG